MRKSLAVASLLLPLATSALAGPPNYAYGYTQGAFAYPQTWPIIPLEMALLPDGRVLNYGTDQNGYQGAGQVYDVWDYKTNSHMVLPNVTQTDLFCSAQTFLSTTGQMLITGGDLTINGERGHSNAQTELFTPATNSISANAAMTYARWYPSAIAQKNGEVVILGGRQDIHVDTPTPEVYSPTAGWRTLPGATSEEAYGFSDANWYYPRAFVNPAGSITLLGNWTATYLLDVSGAGSIATLSPDALYPGDYKLPALMYAPGKVLSLRANMKVNLIDLNTNAVTFTSDVDQVRYWANTTVLANGKVFLNGGSTVDNELTGVSHSNETWDPNTGQWTKGAYAQIARLYHSTALLLPDASVVTASGGAPGPVSNLNAEVYYPSYLYNPNGTPATRPSIAAAPATVKVGAQFVATMAASAAVSKVTFVRSGSVTHSFNPDQRFIDLTFSRNAQNLTISTPTNPDVLLPGYYMLFVFNSAGVPSVAKIVKVTL